jgi:hypothetical protein
MSVSLATMVLAVMRRLGVTATPLFLEPGAPLAMCRRICIVVCLLESVQSVSQRRGMAVSRTRSMLMPCDAL